MGVLKEFIKENSPNTPKKKKKKKRVRLKNFNPFRKRSYKTLNEDQVDSSHPQQHPHTSPKADDQSQLQFGQRTDKSTGTTDKQGTKRRHPRQLLHAARGSLGFTKGNPDDPCDDGRKKSRKHGSTECLIETSDPVEPEDNDVASGPKSNALPESAGETSEKGNLGSGVKRVAISDDIEVIETPAEEKVSQNMKKKKSTKKRIKKAGIKTIKMLGEGMANMATSLQYMSPDAAMAPVVKEIALRQEDRYRTTVSAMAYSMIT